MQFLCEQDREDYEQEKRINEWLRRVQPERIDLIENQHINRKGNARNTLIRAKFSLDQDIRRDDPKGGSFANIVAGLDGRSLEDGSPDYHFRVHFDGTVWETLTALGLNEEEIICLLKMWLQSGHPSAMHSLTLTTDLEWESL